MCPGCGHEYCDRCSAEEITCLHFLTCCTCHSISRTDYWYLTAVNYQKQKGRTLQ